MKRRWLCPYPWLVIIREETRPWWSIIKTQNRWRGESIEDDNPMGSIEILLLIKILILSFYNSFSLTFLMHHKAKETIKLIGGFWILQKLHKTQPIYGWNVLLSPQKRKSKKKKKSYNRSNQFPYHKRSRNSVIEFNAHNLPPINKNNEDEETPFNNNISI